MNTSHMTSPGRKFGILLTGTILVLLYGNLIIGSVHIPVDAVWDILCGQDVEKRVGDLLFGNHAFPNVLRPYYAERH